MLDVSREFVDTGVERYNRRYRKRDQLEERAIREWLMGLPEPKYLNKKYFVRLARWKTPRQRPAYERNPEARIIEATRLAYSALDPLVKLHVLIALEGVNVAVAACILHYLHPDRFPIFDIRARTTLKKQGMWNRRINDASDKAWEDYIGVMRQLSKRLGVSLRELDKALFAYDKWGGE